MKVIDPQTRNGCGKVAGGARRVPLSWGETPASQRIFGSCSQRSRSEDVRVSEWLAACASKKVACIKAGLFESRREQQAGKERLPPLAARFPAGREFDDLLPLRVAKAGSCVWGGGYPGAGGAAVKREHPISQQH